MEAIFNTRTLLTYCSIILLLVTISGFAVQAQSPKCYEADIMISESVKTFTSHIIKQGYKFKLNTTDSTPQETLYDGNSDGIAWEYFKKSKTAGPDFSSTIRRVNLLIKSLGKERLAKEYAIPLSGLAMFEGLGKSNAFVIPRIDIANISLMNGMAWKLLGTEKIDGYVCQIFGYNLVRKEQLANKKIWLHKPSGLILKMIDEFKLSSNSPVMKRTVIVSHLKLGKSFPDSTFKLPSGTKVSMPETFNAVKIPGGLIRSKLSGDGRMTGIGFGGGGTKVLNP